MTHPSGWAAPARRSTGAVLVRSGVLLLGGLVVHQLATVFHPGSETPDDHPAVFAEYAASRDWVAVHFAQFLAALVVLAGFLALRQAVPRREEQLLPAVALGAAVATAAAVAVNMAVDGVALKQAVDAWAAAPPADKAARFATAETVRWLEWGANSFFQVLLGLTAALVGLVLIQNRTTALWIGVAGILTGGCLIWSGVAVAVEGFVASPVGVVASVLFAGMALGILVQGLLRARTRAARRPSAQRVA